VIHILLRPRSEFDRDPNFYSDRDPNFGTGIRRIFRFGLADGGFGAKAALPRKVAAHPDFAGVLARRFAVDPRADEEEEVGL